MAASRATGEFSSMVHLEVSQLEIEIDMRVENAQQVEPFSKSGPKTEIEPRIKRASKLPLNHTFCPSALRL
jgi:hypothetical protein